MTNPHTGSTFESHLEEQDILLDSEFEALSKEEQAEFEELAKKCPRCGGKSANPGNPSGRCRKHLSKLSSDKKKPGSWQRAQTKADDALRRQKGKNGTASKKSSGLGNRDSIVKQTQSAEKKTGQKLSPDRKNNSKGYAAKNTRMVPEKLNRGRHHVDPKKLRNWKKRLKKSELDTDFLFTALLAKAEQDQNQEVLTLLHELEDIGLSNYIDIFDTEELNKSIDVEEAEKELAKTPYHEIQKSTAWKWAGRAAATFNAVEEEKDPLGKVKRYHLAEEFRHEAIEHAALYEDNGKLVAKVEKELDSYRDKALADMNEAVSTKKD
jgi:hypothetical protein